MFKTKYENYFITEGGEVFSNKTGIIKPMKQRKNSSGYYSVKLTVNKLPKHMLVHRLLAESLLGEIPKKMTVNHIDGNKLNNNINNLEIISNIDNVKHSYNTGLHKYGEAHERATIPNSTLINFIHDVQAGMSVRQASKKYGITQSYANRIINKKYRKDIWDLV